MKDSVEIKNISQRLGEKSLQNTNLIKNWYPKCPKNS